MTFACQSNSYLKEFETKVLAVKAAKISIQQESKKRQVSGFEVVCEDTILFPEGGGQNTDRGWINGHEVLQVIRRGKEAVHFVRCEQELKVGEIVKQVVDWERRFDHMQQHSGQHLISALFEKILHIPTLSWWMAENTSSRVGLSYVELGVEKLDQRQIETIETECNEAIRRHLSVDVIVFDENDPDLFEKAKTRGLPDDHSGPVRVIEIGNGLDSNMCCGTHVSNLSELQMVKLLNVENSKRKGNVNLYFLVGNRVSKFLTSAFDRERKITEIVSGGPDEHITLIEKQYKNARIFQKSYQALARELATKDAELIKRNKLKYFFCHRSEPGSDYVSCLINEVCDQDVALLITSGDEKGDNFQLVFTANESLVTEIGQRILQALEAKGGGKGRRLNAKFTSLKNLKKAQDILKNHFSEQTSTED